MQGDDDDVNAEGLTWVEWARAAGLDPDSDNRRMLRAMQDRWRSGEDPSETRAEMAKPYVRPRH